LEIGLSLAGVGDVSVWEFSGYQPYYLVYDQFVGDVNCIHVVVVNLSDPRDVQLSQLLYWLQFITARVSTSQPIGMLDHTHAVSGSHFVPSWGPV